MNLEYKLGISMIPISRIDLGDIVEWLKLLEDDTPWASNHPNVNYEHERLLKMIKRLEDLA